jgi:TolB-like protein
MNASPKAVFLSYASQDADAAQRICDALRAAGVVVWFDKTELRGGDAWDASIRRQIKECALFVPIISANTQAREEGYFRREWNLAVNRTLDMAHDKAFLLPIVIDATDRATVRVPEKFREVQWTQLPDGETPTAFTAHVRSLLSGGDGRAPPAATAHPVAGHPPQAAVPTDDSPSIAVLPFLNMSRDEENEYFADGLSEELLNVLAKVRGLRVASRTSAFSFKGKDIDIAAVAGKLNVATVLEGSVRKAGQRVRITVQLIDVASDSHLWSETYDRELDDIFAVQDDIAQSVVKELRATLMGAQAGAASMAAADVRRAATGRSHNAEAFQLYLQGKFFGERVTQADSDKAIELLRQALAIDPGFALAWAELSRTHQMQAGFGFAPIDEGFERAREAAQQALRLAPDLAEGHVALGSVLEHHDWNWAAARASFQRALALAPGDARVLEMAALHTRIRGQHEEGLGLIRKAVALDPLSATLHRQMAHLCVMSGRLDDAASALERAIDLNPAAGLSHAFLALVRMIQGRVDGVLELARAESHDVFRNMAIAMIQHRLGRPAESDDALTELIGTWGWTAAYQVAQVYAFREQADEAFEWLERAYAQRDPGLIMSAHDEFLQPLHGDVRWRTFVQRLGLA